MRAYEVHGATDERVRVSPRRRDVAVALLAASPVRVAALWSPLFLAHTVNPRAPPPERPLREGGISRGHVRPYGPSVVDGSSASATGTFSHRHRRRRRGLLAGTSLDRRTRRSLCVAPRFPQRSIRRNNRVSLIGKLVATPCDCDSATEHISEYRNQHPGNTEYCSNIVTRFNYVAIIL